MPRAHRRGAGADAGAYAEHLIDQAADVLRTQDIGVLCITPPPLERLARRDDLMELVREKVRAIRWGGTHLDPDSRYLYRTEIFPQAAICGNYGSTMMLGVAGERPGLPDEAPWVFEPPAPYVTFSVVRPDTGVPVGYGERGRVLVSHVEQVVPAAGQPGAGPGHPDRGARPTCRRASTAGPRGKLSGSSGSTWPHEPARSCRCFTLLLPQDQKRPDPRSG